MPDLRGARVAVTGGHGLIGRHVVAALAAAGAEPVAIYHPLTEPVSGLPGESRAVDLEDPSTVGDAVAGTVLVIHLAARAGGIGFQRVAADDTFTVNRRVTDNVLAACRHNGVQRVFLASSLVIYRPSPRPLDEDHPLLAPADGPSPYARSKIADEEAARREDGCETVVGRFGNVYGPGASFDPARATVVPSLLARAFRLGDGEALEVWGDGTAVRSFLYAQDAARAVLAVLVSGEAGAAYNIDSGEPVTIADLAAGVVAAVNPTLTIAFDSSKPSGDPFRLASIDRLQALGHRGQVDLATGLKRTADWYRDHIVHS